MSLEITGGYSYKLAVFKNFLRSRPISNIERAKLRVLRAGLVESHLVNNLAKVFRVPAPQSHHPFPVIQANADRNELANFTGKRDPTLSMLSHHGIASF